MDEEKSLGHYVVTVVLPFLFSLAIVLIVGMFFFFLSSIIDLVIEEKF